MTADCRSRLPLIAMFYPESIVNVARQRAEDVLLFDQLVGRVAPAAILFNMIGKEMVAPCD